MQQNRIKFVETCGTKYIDFLRTPNPFKEICKPEEKCLVCENGDSNSDCKVTNIGYSLRCILCKERRRNISYEGESARNGYLRSREHLKDFEKKNKKSIILKHILNDHKEEENSVKFEMKIVGKFKSSLNRQIDESLRIRNKPPGLILNSKSEFYGPVVKRKVFE